MLEMRSTCERCDVELAPESLAARICSYECTFCAPCADGVLGGRCPNCGGELLARPTRPPAEAHPGVLLRRYAASWRDGDGFTLHYGGSSRFSGTYVGRDAALAVMAEVSVLAPRELRSVDDVLTGDHGGALVVTERLTRDGAVHDLVRMLRYRVEQGHLVECWLHEADQALADHLWR